MVNRYGKMISTDRVYILMSIGLFSFYFGGLKLVPFLTNIEHTYNAIQDAIGEKLSSFYPFQSTVVFRFKHVQFKAVFLI